MLMMYPKIMMYLSFLSWRNVGVASRHHDQVALGVSGWQFSTNTPTKCDGMGFSAS